MGTDGLTSDLRDIRAADSNSLLRLYDLARERLGHAFAEQDRLRADRALQRIVKELRKRKVPF